MQGGPKTHKVKHLIPVGCRSPSSSPLQLMLNAAARLVVKKGKWDINTATIRDNLHWLLVVSIQVSSPARRSVPRNGSYR